MPLDLSTSKVATRGKTFAAGLIVARTDTGEFLTRGTITCKGTIGGKRVTLAGRSFGRKLGSVRKEDPMAVCTWRIPRKPRGTTLRGSITVGFDGLVARDSFSKRVR